MNLWNFGERSKGWTGLDHPYENIRWERNGAPFIWSNLIMLESLGHTSSHQQADITSNFVKRYSPNFNFFWIIMKMKNFVDR